MIPNSADVVMPSAAASASQQRASDWQSALTNVIREPEELLGFLGIQSSAEQLAAMRQASRLFPLRVPRSYAARMRPHAYAEPFADPLLRQVLPLDAELTGQNHGLADPVGDLSAMPTAGLLHKYHGRALLVTTGACAIHCRYCFRREFPYSDANPKQQQWLSALNYLRADPTISEVILSGGDPLTLSTAVLAQLFAQLEQIPHLRRIRIHSRLAIVLPERLDAELLALFADSRLQLIHVLHCNHAQEIDDSIIQAVASLRALGQLVLNQAVLLHGVNDTIDAQTALCEQLIGIGVLPYYLHMLDPVRGAQHFMVSETTALNIHQALQTALSGYMVPRLVREIPGQAAKTLLTPAILKIAD